MYRDGYDQWSDSGRYAGSGGSGMPQEDLTAYYAARDRPLARSRVLELVNAHETDLIQPQVDRACQRVARVVLEGAQYGQRQFEVVVCKRDKDEVDDVWHRRQVLLWEGLIALGLEEFELKTEFVDRKQAIVLNITY